MYTRARLGIPVRVRHAPRRGRLGQDFPAMDFTAPVDVGTISLTAPVDMTSAEIPLPEPAGAGALPTTVVVPGGGEIPADTTLPPPYYVAAPGAPSTVYAPSPGPAGTPTTPPPATPDWLTGAAGLLTKAVGAAAGAALDYFGRSLRPTPPPGYAYNTAGQLMRLPAPAGYTYNAAGQLVAAPTSSWLWPALLAGGAGIALVAWASAKPAKGGRQRWGAA